MLPREKTCPLCGDRWSSKPSSYSTCRRCGYLLVDLEPSEAAERGDHFECLLCGTTFLAEKVNDTWSALECPRCMEKWPNAPARRSRYFDWLSWRWWEEGYSTNGRSGLRCECGRGTDLLVNGLCGVCRRAA